MIQRPARLVLAFLLGPILLGQTPEGSGIVYGNKHAFLVDAPKGWVLDNNAQQNNGLCAVFYPVGSSWAKAPVVMYANSAVKGEGQRTVAELIAFDTQSFRKKAPTLRVADLPSIKTKDGDAVVKKFSGDQFNNSEAVAYIDTPEVVVMLVFTSRDEKGFLANYSAFEELVGSYKFFTTDVRIEE